MMLNMRRRLAGSLIALLVLAAPSGAFAQDDAEKIYDARLENYPNKMTLDESGGALTWMLLIVLAVVGAGVLFKNAQRTHLD